MLKVELNLVSTPTRVTFVYIFGYESRRNDYTYIYDAFWEGYVESREVNQLVNIVKY